MELLNAYILHTRPWRDTSYLVDILTLQRGRVRGVARGLRKQSGKNKGNICQPFRPLLLSLRGRGELQTVAAIEPDGPPCTLPGDHLYAAFYANEILLRALPESDPHPVLFRSYRALLDALAMPGLDIEPFLRRFELSLLDELGYGIDFFHDAASGGELQADCGYVFVAEEGFVAREHGQVRERHELYAGSHVLAVGRGEFDSAACRLVAKKVMRQALLPLLGDRPLNSRLLYRPADSSKK